MDSTIVTNFIIPISTALVSVLTAMGVCISAVGSIKKSKAQIIEANSSTNIGRLEKAVDKNSETAKALNEQSRSLIVRVGEVVADNQKLAALSKDREAEYLELSESSKQMIGEVRTFQAMALKDHDQVRELVNAGKRQLMEAYIEQKAINERLIEENARLTQTIERLDRKLDVILENRRAR